MSYQAATTKLGIVGGLTGRRAQFVNAIFESDSFAEAGRSLGVTRNTVNTWLRTPSVQRAIVIEARRRQKHNDARIERLRAELEYIAYTDVTDIVGWANGVTADGTLMPERATIKSIAELTPAQRACVKSVKFKINQWGQWVEVEFHDKMKALEMLGKMLGLFAPEEAVIEDLNVIADQIRRHSSYEQEQQKLARERQRALIEHSTGEVVDG